MRDMIVKFKYAVELTSIEQWQNETIVAGDFIFYTGAIINRVRNFRGRVSHFNQSEARKQCFLASDWLKYETLPENFVLYMYIRNIKYWNVDIERVLSSMVPLNEYVSLNHQ